MRNAILLVMVAAGSALAQYKAEPAGAPPAEVPAAIAATLQKTGAKIVSGTGTVVCEVWFRATAPSGPKSTEEGVAIPVIPHGSLMGVLRFPAKGEDRRGQAIPPGLYTLRYSMHPVNGDHLGVAPQRDFLVLTPVADDKNPAATPKFDDLMIMSRKASGTPHPAVLSLSTSSHSKFPDLVKEGEHDWVLHGKIGDMAVALTVVGRAEG